MTGHTQSLRDLANEVATTQPALGRRLHEIASHVAAMEAMCDAMVEQARQAERLHVLNETGVVVIPGMKWGRA